MGTAEARLERLQRVAGALSALLSPAEVADEILRAAAPELGGISRALWLVDETGTQLALVDPANHERAAPFASIPLAGELPGAVVARTGEPLFLETRAERDTRFAALAGTGPQVSFAVLPLTAGGMVIGVLACSYDEEHTFQDDERRFLVAVGELASQSLERSRLHARQVEVARALQSSLLPPVLPAITGIDLAAAYHPAWEGADVGGDFYDVFPLSQDDLWAFTIGDVCGTGPEAAALTAQARHTVRAVLRTGVAIDAALALVNDTLVESLDDERFCTMVLAEARRTAEGVAVRLIAAGHPEPLVVRAAGGVEVLPSRGALVGAFGGQTYGVESIDLGSGDVLVLYTDGVIEARSAEPETSGRFGFFGDDRLIGALEPLAGAGAAAIVNAVEKAVIDFSGRRLADDVAVLAVGAV